MIVAGIDPGKAGGLAKQRAIGTVEVIPMPVAGKEIDGLAIVDFLNGVDLVVIEKVASMPKQGVKSTFTFGKGYGILHGICWGGAIPFELVTPQRWKGTVLAGTSKDKDAAIAYCRRRFPHVSLLPTPRCSVPSDGMADALCLMEYGRRMFGMEVAA